MAKRDKKGGQEIEIRACFMLSPPYSHGGLLMRGCMLAQAENGSKCRDLGEGENLNIWLTSILFSVMGESSGGGQAVLLIFYETSNGNLEGVYLALSQVNKGSIHDSYLSHMEKGGSFQ